MTRIKVLFVALAVAAAMSMAPMANAAPVLHYAAAGSSAMFQQFALTVVNDLATTAANCPGGVGVGCNVHHFTIKSTCSDSTQPGTPCVGIVDARNHAIPVESATYWVAWICPLPGDCNGSNATDVWYYDQVDSTVGVRTYLGAAATLKVTTYVAPGVQTGVDPANNANTNLINPILFLHGDSTALASCGGASTCDAIEVPADVYTAINGSVLNTGMTDIRPEDALFATERANSASTLSPWTGLGYGGGPTTLVGASIASAFTATFATPIFFGLPGGSDPFTSQAVPSTITVFPVGEEPILFIANRSNGSGLGSVVASSPWYNDVQDNGGAAVGTPSPIGQLFGGVDCSGSSNAIGNYSGGTFTGGLPPSTSDFGVNPILREALSGTMNTTEFSSLRSYGGSLGGAAGNSSVSNSNLVPTTSQESNLINVAGQAPVNPLGGGPAANPPGTACSAFGSGSGLGKRYRAIGTGEEVGKPGGTGVGLIADSIGYTFFSFANVKALTGSANYGYLQLDGVDPIFANYANGALPACNPALNGSAGGCLKGDVWPGGNLFPNLTNGTYRAWSLLRAICDTAGPTCLKSTDPLGTEAIIALAQDDINGTGPNPGKAIADFLPFSDDNSFGPGGGFGLAKFVRSHYAFNSGVGVHNNQYPGSHITPSFSIFPAGLNTDQANGTGGSPEAGGDAGGCIIPAEKPQVLSVTGAFGTNPSSPGAFTKMKLNYTALAPGQTALTGVCGPGSGAGYTGQPCVASFLNSENSATSTSPTPGVNCGNLVGTCNAPASGISVAVTGFPAADNADNGVFQVTRILYDGQIKVRYEPAVAGQVKTVTAPAQATANTGCSE